MNLSPRVLKLCAYVCAALLSLSLVLGVSWTVSQQRTVAASGFLIRLNTPCVGKTAYHTYYGKWKKLGARKVKCLEGAGGEPGELVERIVCRIVTIHDGTFDNSMITSSTKCQDV